MGILIALLIIMVIIMVIRQLPVIAITCVFGTILLLSSVWMLRNVVHAPIDDYADLSKVDYLSEKVKLKSDEEIAEDEKKKEKSDYDNMSAADLDKLKANIKRIEEGKDVVTTPVTKKTTDKPLTSSHKEASSEEKIQRFTYTYKDYTSSESRITIFNEHRDRIKDKKFKTKLLGMTSYVALDYDLGNARMYNTPDYQAFIIEYK